MSRREMLVTPHRQEDIDFREWQLLSMNNLVVGEVAPKNPGGGYDMRYQLFDVFSGKKLLVRIPCRPPRRACAMPRIASPMPSTSN
jgi:hypothetical protein